MNSVQKRVKTVGKKEQAMMFSRDYKFGIQIGSDWPQIGQMGQLFKISVSTFWSGILNLASKLGQIGHK